jgi:hypothetical protein
LLDDISGDADGHIVGRRFGERVFVRIYESISAMMEVYM